MGNDFYKQMFQKSPVGYVYSRVICDEEGIPCDYKFIGVNAAFERFTGLKGSDILGRSRSELLMGTQNNVLNWIDFEGEIVINSGKKELVNPSDCLPKWYRVMVYTLEKEYLITSFIDISKEYRQLDELRNLADEKAKQAAELIITNIEFTRQYEEIEKRAAELEITKEQAEAANVMRNQFLANMSHEIRTSINGVMGFLELMLRFNPSTEHKEYIREAKSASATLLHIFDDSLDLSNEEESIPIRTEDRVRKYQNEKIPKILLVEDNEINRKIFIAMLKTQNMTCDVTINGLEAYQAVLRKNYDIVFMDCQMPEMDGYQTTEKIRRLEGNSKHTTIVAMTANALKGDKDKCLAAGMDYYIKKPLNFGTMFQLIDDACGDIKASSEYLDFLGSYIDPFVISTGLTQDEAKEIFVNFAKNLSNLLLEVENSLAQNDLEKIARLAHQLKGTSGTLKIASIFDFASKLEEAAKDQEKEICEIIFKEVQMIVGSNG